MKRTEIRKVNRMLTTLQSSSLLIGMSMVSLLAGCSSGGGSTTTTTTTSPSISISFSPAPPTSLQISATTSLTAVVANSSSNSDVTWAVTCGSAGACGSLSSTSTASGASTTYTAPSSVPSGSTVTVTVTSAADSSVSASATITITSRSSGGAPANLPTGTWVFSLTGVDSIASTSMAGSFYANSGTISGGEQDVSIPGGYRHVAITGGSYSVASNQNVQIALTTSDNGLGVNGTETLQAVMVSSSKALLVEFDSFAAVIGTMELQNGSPAPSGGYAFSVGGMDNNGSPVVMGGVLNVDSAGGISGNGSVFDLNDGGSHSTDESFAASTVTTPDTWGRCEFALVPSTASGVKAINFIGYIVGSQEVRLIETADNFLGGMVGTALSQGSNTGNFSSSSVSGSSYIFDAVIPTRPLAVAGLVAIGSNGSASGTLNLNDPAEQSPQSGNTYTGTYTVDSTGRATFSGLSDGNATPSFSYNVEVYFTGNGDALMISMDASDELIGEAFQQTGSFSAASFKGSYAMSAVIPKASEYTEDVGVGLLAADGVGSLTGNLALNEDTQSTASLSITGTFISGSNGVFTGTMTGLNPASPTTAAHFAYYLADSSHVIAIETDNQQVVLMDLEAQ